MRVSKTPEEGSIPSTPATSNCTQFFFLRVVCFFIIKDGIEPHGFEAVALTATSRSRLWLKTSAPACFLNASPLPPLPSQTYTQFFLRFVCFLLLNTESNPTGSRLPYQTAASRSRLWLKTSAPACFLNASPLPPLPHQTAHNSFFKICVFFYY